MHSTQLLAFIIVVIIIIAVVLWVRNSRRRQHPRRGGLGEKCGRHDRCANGLTCSSHDICICQKPQSPTVFVTTGPFSIDATWTSVEFADYYCIVLEGPQNETFMFYTSTSISIQDLEPGTYALSVYAGSFECGLNETPGTIPNIVLAGCTSNTDCTVGLCNNGNCVQCLSNTDCSGGQICNDNNVCTGCTQDCQCPNGQACVSGLCGNCSTNTDCPTGEVCSGGQCVQCGTTFDCGDGHVCVDNACVPCTSNSQCINGNICNSGTCEPCTSTGQCDAGELCLNGQCVQCETTADCASGNVCVNGSCVSCSTSSQCINGQVCVSGSCTACTTNSQCLNGDACIGGACQACTADFQCDTGEVCSAGLCICEIPVVNSVTLTGGPWPNQITFAFNVSNADPNSRFTFGWKLYGNNNPSDLAVSGFAPNVLLPDVSNNFTFFISTSIPPAYTCSAGLNYGCPGTCGFGNVTLALDHLVVTNSCGQSSISQCFILPTLCTGGPTVFTPTAC